MAIQLGEQNRVFTAKFSQMRGSIEFVDISATGSSDAQDKFKEMYPNAELINIFRKQ